MSADRPHFQTVQAGFTAWLREPQTVAPPPAMEMRRLNIYRELFFNNVTGFVESGFPVLKSRLPTALWQRLTERFFAEHHCQTPYFHEIAQEFLTYFSALEWPELADYPWSRELAHYEWVELAAEIHEAEDRPDAVQADGDLLEGVPCLNPLVWPLVYQWPVHALAELPLPLSLPEQPTCLLVYRDADEQVRFMQVNALTAHLVECLQAAEPRSGRALLQALAASMGFADTQAFVAGGLAVLEELRMAGVILGVRLAAL